LLGLALEGEEMAMRIAEKLIGTDKLQIPYVFKGSFKKSESFKN
jgi:2-dehydro-3-deoxyphosphooctonate aldolase (KDO 8-P synthase)